MSKWILPMDWGKKTIVNGKHKQIQFSLVQLLSRVWLFATHESQHARPPCPSPTPRVYPNSCPLSRWCHATISSSVIPFSSHLQSFSASGSFQMSQFFPSGEQSIGVSTSAMGPSNEYSRLISFRMDCSDLLTVQGIILKNLLQHHSSKTSILWYSAFFIVQISHPYMTTGKSSSFHKPRQHIKKQRHYFANKGPSSQSYGFSSGHV